MHYTARRLAPAFTLASVRTKTRAFHATTSALVNVGDSVPGLDLVEDSPGNTVNLAKELSQGKGLIIGVPAAFSEWVESFCFKCFLA